jgi:hypothetical protein
VPTLLFFGGFPFCDPLDWHGPISHLIFSNTSIRSRPLGGSSPGAVVTTFRSRSSNSLSPTTLGYQEDMEPLVGGDQEMSLELTDELESVRQECNSPLPRLPLPEGMSRDIESGMDADDAFRKALQGNRSPASNEEEPSPQTAVNESNASSSQQPSIVPPQTMIDKDDVIVSEPRDYFAMGEDQDIQCIASCQNSYEDRKRRTDRIVPCFTNAPLKCFRGYCPRIFTCYGNRFRVCSRAGNFTVLLERLIPQSGYSAVKPMESVAAENDDELLRPYQPPKRELWLVMGPYWPFCLTLTTSLIILIPALIILILWYVLPYREILYAFMGMTVLTLCALASVACRDPGLVPHYSDEPEESKNAPANVRPSNKWIFNDLTSSWRPRGAVYDKDVNAVIDHFDHVCPFTGTAIGGNNIQCFYGFVAMINILTCCAVLVGGVGLYYFSKAGWTIDGFGKED